MKEDFIFKKLLHAIDEPKSLEEIFELFSNYREINKKMIVNVLEDLEAKGKIIQTRAGLYGITERMNLLVGRIKKQKKGFGFLVTDNIDEDDLYISHGDLNSAQNGDKVIVRITRPSKIDKNGRKYRAEGKVIRVLERHNHYYIGTYKSKKFYAVVVPDNQTFGYDIMVPLVKQDKHKNGDKVLVKITNWGNEHENAEGVIVKNIGNEKSPGVDILSLVYRYDLEPEFTKEQLKEAEYLCSQPFSFDIDKRRDFRLYRLVTIDGADSKDLDDAVSLEILSNGNYLLGVHIADVAEYIKENSILDKEAFKRGTSVYFVDRVLPMLPPSISNGICSLNEDEDRLTLSCVMEINQNGDVLSVEISESVINVAKRFTYDEVNAILETQTYSDNVYVQMFNEMNDLRKILYKKRQERGALDFDLPESKVILGENGCVESIEWHVRGQAEKIIEEFMLKANETIAAYFFRHKVPFIYRVHEAPDQEKIDVFCNYLQTIGIPVKKMDDGSLDLQYILQKAEEKSCQNIVTTMLLRMMNHAYYTVNKTSHFGLALKYYTHFTSPIRRYSDLSIHRIIKEFLKGNRIITERRATVYQNLFSAASEQASLCERNAEEAERASVAIKKAEYMIDYVGEEYEGMITSVTSFGFFVQLDNSIEGLVHISSLHDDYYNYDEDNLCLLGERSGQKYEIGQKVNIKVADVNLKEVKIDFVLAGEELLLPLGRHERNKNNPIQKTKGSIKKKKSNVSRSKERRNHSGHKNHYRKPKSKA